MITRRMLLALVLAAPTPVFAQGTSGAPALETVAGGLQNPWSLAFLPDGRMLVTERPGRLRLVSTSGAVSAPLGGVPDVWANGQGGLLDVVLAPDFATSRRLYLSFAEPRDGGAATSVLSARLAEDAGRLENPHVIFRQQPASSGPVHFGSRIVPARDGTLFIGLGERGQKERAQDMTTHYGKVVRINPDGSVPRDNPFLGRRDRVLPEIYSLGHRNIQGAALHPVTGRLWTVEHGAMGGDEINTPQAGKNYGWPTITYGKDYSGAKIGVGTSAPGLEQPLHYWDPSIAPSGMLFYTGDAYPAWKGSLFIGGLAGSLVARLTLDGEKILREERLFSGLGHRYRDIRQGPDGLIYLLLDGRDGKIMRIRAGR